MSVCVRERECVSVSVCALGGYRVWVWARSGREEVEWLTGFRSHGPHKAKQTC